MDKVEATHVWCMHGLQLFNVPIIGYGLRANGYDYVVHRNIRYHASNPLVAVDQTYYMQASNGWACTLVLTGHRVSLPLAGIAPLTPENLPKVQYYLERISLDSDDVIRILATRTPDDDFPCERIDLTTEGVIKVPDITPRLLKRGALWNT